VDRDRGGRTHLEAWLEVCPAGAGLGGRLPPWRRSAPIFSYGSSRDMARGRLVLRT
jgi:hypothetical protein